MIDKLLKETMAPVKHKFDYLLQDWNDGWLLHLYERNPGKGMEGSKPSEHVKTIGAGTIESLIDVFNEYYP